MKLSVLKNNSLVSEVDFDKEVEGISSALTFFIGRAETCHVVLDDQQISREHAELSYSNGHWTIKKISKLSLIMINGSVIEQSLLNSGDIISIGPFTISVFMRPKIESSLKNNMMTETAIETQTETVTNDEQLAQTELLNVESNVNPDEFGNNQSPGDSFNEDDRVKEFSTESSDEESGVDFSPIDDEASDDEIFRNDESENNSEDNSENNSEHDLGDNSFDESYGEYGDNDGEFDDGFDNADDSDDDVSEKTIVFNSFAKFELELFGEFAPYDKYVIDKAEIRIGRDPDKCQIVLSDPEVSGVHAIIKKSNILCVLEDLKSANGTIHNGSRINSIELANGDEFIIGSTTFTVRVISDLLSSENGRLMPVEDNQEIEVEEIQEVSGDFNDDELTDSFSDSFSNKSEEVPKSLVGKFKVAWKDPAKKKRIIIYGGVLLVLAFFLFGEDGDTAKNKIVEKKVNTKVDSKGNAIVSNQKKKILSPEQEEFANSRYLLAKQYIESGRYNDAIFELESVVTVDPNYKETVQLLELAKQGRAKLEKAEQERQKKLQEAERKRKVEKLLELTTKAVEEHNSETAKGLFSQIALLEPDNFEVEQLKVRLKSWEEEQERLAVEKARKEADRKRKLEQFKPSQALYIKKDWFNAIVNLERFLKIKEMDEDLIKKATEMLEKSREKLNSVVGPLLGKARSLGEGQDLKGAYENYQKVLKYDPNNTEALNEINEIRDTLNLRAKKIYREAIIVESLSLFKDAKEKFQEVQQIAPTDNEYYKKATEKLKDYME